MDFIFSLQFLFGQYQNDLVKLVIVLLFCHVLKFEGIFCLFSFVFQVFFRFVSVALSDESIVSPISECQT